MSEHLTQSQIEGYSGRNLPPAELLIVSDHLSACEQCRLAVERALNAESAFFALHSEIFAETPEALAPPVAQSHLSPAQISDYIEAKSSGEERQVIADHLGSCQLCALAVDDLREFRNSVAPGLDREYLPHETGGGESRRRRFILPLPAGLWRSPTLAFGAAFAALLLVAAGWLIWQSLREKSERQEVVTVTPSPVPSPDRTPPPTPATGGTAAPLIAQIVDGVGSVTVDQAGRITGVEQLPPAYQQMMKEALASGRMEKSSLLAGLSRPGSALMGGDEQGNRFSVTDPVGEVVLSDRPTFRWSQLAGASSYVVEVYDESFNPVAESPSLDGMRWSAPQPLKRGASYTWQVKALKDGREFLSPQPPAPQAKFRILDRARANELAEARQAHASSHLLLGLLYARAGLLDEAEGELRALQQANPNSEIAGRLLASVRAMRR